jgi:hypothetical protein
MEILDVIAVILDQEKNVKDNSILEYPSLWGFIDDGRENFVSPEDSVPLREQAKGNNVYVSLNDIDFYELAKDGSWTEVEKNDFELRGLISASREKILSLVD